MAITPINLGNSFLNGNGGSVLGGVSSGLNTQSIINGLVASQSAQVTTLQDKVTVNNNQLSALTSLQQLLSQLQTSAAQLGNPQSPDLNSNAFAAVSANITSNTSQAASNFITATAAADTPAGTYTISNITKLATATSQQTDPFTVDPATTAVVVASGAVAGQFNAGTFTIQGPDGTGSVTFTAGDDLNQIADDFNAASGTTGLTATVTTTSAGVYTLAFTDTTTGDPVTFNLNSPTYITSDPSQVFGAQTTSSYTLSAATNPVVVASGAGSGQFNAGTYTIVGPGGSGTVTLHTGDTLSQVATDFNNAQSSTGIAATVLQTSPGVYTLVFNATSTGGGGQFNFDLSDTSPTTTVTDGSGHSISLGGVIFAAPVDGQNAQFELNGTTITRSTNTISDLISGVTLNLLQNTNSEAGASFTLQVAPDTSSIQSAVTNFVNAYNNFLVFYSQQTALNSNGLPASSAILYSDTTLRNVYNQLSTEVASIVGGLSASSLNQFSDIGISFINAPANSTTPAVNNALSIDSTTFDAAVQNNLTAVENIFGYNLTSSSPDVASYKNATNSTVSNFTLNVDPNAVPPSYTATYGPDNTQVTFTAESLGGGGLALTADPTSALAGLILIYTGSGNQDNISVTTTQGIGANINNFLTSALTANSGLLAVDQSGIQKSTTTIQTQITNVNTQVSNTRTELLQKFSALESAIAEANSSLNLLNAQQLANSSTGG